MSVFWPAVTVTLVQGEHVSPAEWEAFCDRVMEAGSTGYEESGEGNAGVPHSATFYFPSREQETGREGDQVESAAEAILPPQCWRLAQQTLPDYNWASEHRPFYHLVQASRRVYVGPPEEARLPDDAPPDAIVVAVEFGNAFGTGTHETTQGCLRQIERLATSTESLLDFGTGTGILCFAAVKLGMEFAVGVDSDLACEAVFQENAELNGVGRVCHFLRASTVEDVVRELHSVGRPVPELIVCNMLSEAFDPLLPGLARISPQLLLSGFLLSEAEVVRGHLTQAGWAVEEENSNGEWGVWYCRSLVYTTFE